MSRQIGACCADVPGVCQGSGVEAKLSQSNRFFRALVSQVKERHLEAESRLVVPPLQDNAALWSLFAPVAANPRFHSEYHEAFAWREGSCLPTTYRLPVET